MKEIKIKMVVVGDPGVGKTSILRQYNNKQFIKSYSATIGVDFAKLDISYNNDIHNLYIWDTSGQDKFKFMTHSFYKNITVALVLYDITSKQSLMNTMNWIDDIKDINKHCYFFLVGNKIDLESHREVKEDDLDTVLNIMKISRERTIECSCKENINIKELFDKIVHTINEDIKHGILKSEKDNGLTVYQNKRLVERNEGKGCCIIL